jgi:hypothetical protein
MVDNLSDFVAWANSVMQEKSITQADIARTGFVTRAAVSALFVLRIKSVGVEMCRAISAATNIPLEVVYQKAGLLPPPAGPLSEEQQAVIHAVSQVSDVKVLRMISAMLDQALEDRDRLGRK